MSDAAGYSRKRPFPAKLLANRCLTGDCSHKETRHFELALAGSGFAYEPGDSLGVFPINCPEGVDGMLRALGATGDEPVGGRPLRAALATDVHLRQPSRQFLQALAEKAGPAAGDLHELLDPARARELEGVVAGLDYVDFLEEYPAVRFAPEEFVEVARKLQPRLYSVASSRRVYPDAAHLTVAAVRYQARGRQRKGVASTFLADLLEVGESIPVFLHSAIGFRLPPDPAVPLIMVGPGTGVAPFRAFLQERHATGAPGKNWLFFGDQRRETDFLYGEEFAAMAETGLLTRLDLAFSRDQRERLYVQHRMLEQAAEVWRWMDGEGAYFYVCGDAKRMAKDVEAALLQIIGTAGGKTPEQAVEYLEKLRVTKRYRRDVY